MELKKLLPSFLRNIYRLHGEVLFYYKRVKTIKRIDNYMLIIGTPAHENLGDHLITYAEELFLNDATTIEVVEVPIEAFKLFKQLLKRYVKSNVKIFIQGGGWMGTVWPNDEFLIQDIVNTFKDNQIVIFPQSAYYEEGEIFNKIVSCGRNVYENRHLSIFLREENSFKTMKALYPMANLYLQPDITFYLKNKQVFDDNRTLVTDTVGLCFRSDREDINDELKKKIHAYLLSTDQRYELFDTLNKSSVREKDRVDILNAKSHEISKYKYIITDRLHGMIFSYLTNVPCIAFDNRTHKVKSVYETWLKEQRSIQYIETFEEFETAVNNIEPMNETHNVKFDFWVLKGVIECGYYKQAGSSSYTKQ